MEAHWHSSGCWQPMHRSGNMGHPPPVPAFQPANQKTPKQRQARTLPASQPASCSSMVGWTKSSYPEIASLSHDSLIVTTNFGLVRQIATERTCFRDTGGHFECMREREQITRQCSKIVHVQIHCSKKELKTCWKYNLMQWLLVPFQTKINATVE